MKRRAAIAGLFAASASAQVFHDPVPIARGEPQYTDEARLVKVQGPVLLSIRITREGTVADVRVLKPLGYGLDDEAVRTAKIWRFRPAARDSEPREVKASLEINFRLPGESMPEWKIGPMLFPYLDGASRPVLIAAVVPGFTEPVAVSPAARLALAFEVDETGRVRNISVLESPHPIIEAAAIAALAQWKFRPAEVNGKPAPVEGTISWTR
jgi:TonB family protein